MKTWIDRAKTLTSLVSVGVLTVGMLSWISSLAPQNTAQVSDTQHGRGHFRANVVQSDFTLSLSAPAIAAQGPGQTVTLQPDQPYLPASLEGSDDYHCFLLDPRLSEDRMVVGVNIKPQQGSLVHHVILFKLSGDAVGAALAKNQSSGGQGWTCFGGPDVGGSGVASSWLGAWVPGVGDGRFPDGVGSSLPKGSLIVMQVHYNLLAGAKPDQSTVELSYAPTGAALKAIRTDLHLAPVELPCPDGMTSSTCNRTSTLRENVKKYGQAGVEIPQGLLSVCNRSLSDYQKPVGDASSISTSCDRRMSRAGTLYSVAGHMHLLGKDIKLELNPDTPQAKILLHIPKWDFHWQGNYWFKNPVEVKVGDVLRVSCTYDNSVAHQPLLAGKQNPPRYVTWGEGTADEMCLGVVGITANN